MEGTESTRNRLAEVQRAILRTMCDATGWSPTRLASETGIAPSTINRRLKPGDQGLISIDLWHRLSATTGVAIPAEILNAAPIASGEINPELLQRVLLVCLTEMRVRDAYRLALELAPQLAYGYQAFLDYEASGRPITDDRAAFKAMRDMLAHLRRSVGARR